MVQELDKIKFESRYEIVEVETALETFLKEHPNAEERQTVTKLSDMLDLMHMCW